jgi:hypothetical protein
MPAATPDTVEAYLASLPDDRRAAVSAVREVLVAHVPPGFEECMSFGMISYVVPLSRYPKTYNRQPLMLAGLVSQKTGLSLHLLNLYMDPSSEEWFVSAWKATGRKLDMGKGCVRFKSLQDLSLELIGEAIGRVSVEDFIARYEASRAK